MVASVVLQQRLGGGGGWRHGGISVVAKGNGPRVRVFSCVRDEGRKSDGF